MKTPKVGIILLNWHNWEDTLACLDSLAGLNYPSLLIVVVDNASNDDALLHLSNHSLQVAIIENKTNLGFTEGNNVGIRYALEHEADYIMLLNNDTITNDPNLIEELIEVAESDPTIGQISPTIYYYDSPRLVWYAGARLNLWTGWRHINKLPPDNNPLDTGYASGCCVLVPARFVREVGLLETDYFLSVEDIEWSLRARKAGWRVIHVPNASLLHKASMSSRDHSGAGVYSPTRVYFEHRNTIWLVRQYGNALQKWLIWPVRFTLRWTYQASGYILLRRWPKLFALFRAIRDGILLFPKPSPLPKE